jgi:EmrB/QacA subfamily drug resistance transporter
MDRKWWTLVVVCAATFMLLLDVTIVIVALPTIQQRLGATFTDVQWVIDAYALTLAALLLTSGSLADRYGRRFVFTIGLSVFTLGSVLCGVAQSPLMLILSRAAQGVGGAILFSTSLALLAQTFHGKERGVAFGVWGAITGVSTGLGPILGGAITSGISWRGIFLVNLPIGVAALIVTRLKVDESRLSHASRPDWGGFATLTAGLVALVYGLIRAGEVSWGDGGVIICFVAAAVLLVLFLVAELRAERPMFDLTLFRVPTFSGGLVAAFCMNGSLYAMFVYLVLYLQDDLGYSALATGVRFLLVTGASLISATIAGRLTTHMPIRWLIGPGLALVGIGLLLMSGLDGTSSWTHLIVGFVLAGVGSGLVNPPLASTAVGVVQPQRAGMASGVNTTFRQIGIAVGIAVYGSIFTTEIHHHLAQSLSGTPTLADRAPEIAAAVQRGDAASVIASVSGGVRGELVAAIRSGFASSLNLLLVVSGVLALVGAVGALALIRKRDFVVTHAAPPAPESVTSDSIGVAELIVSHAPAGD